MRELITEASTLGVLLEETRGVVGVVLGTAEGELRTVIGSFLDGAATAATAASLTGELNKIGTMLGLGALGVASLKSPTAARVFAHQADAVLAIELDPKRPIGELEVKLRTLPWAREEPREEPATSRATTVPHHERTASPSTPPPLSASAPGPPAPLGPATLPVSTTPTVGPVPAANPAPPGLNAPNRLASTPPKPAPMAANRAASTTRPPPIAGAIRPSAPNGAPTRPLASSANALPRAPTPATSTRTRLQSAPVSAAIRASSPTSLPAQVKSVGSGPVFTGDLEEFCLPDLLEFLRNSHRSGLLMCTSTTGVGMIQLSRGMIISASSPNALDLREHFLNSPEVGPERRRALAALPVESFGDDLIDGVVVSRDLVPPDAMERARVARIYSAFREMMRWTVGRFSFDPGFAVVTNPALALSAQTILMHIYQEQDEQGR